MKLMVLLHLIATGLWKRLDLEKIRFFFGWTSPLFLSHARPMARHLNWLGLLVRPDYARAVVDWLAWRMDLYDGERS